MMGRKRRVKLTVPDSYFVGAGSPVTAGKTGLITGVSRYELEKVFGKLQMELITQADGEISSVKPSNGNTVLMDNCNFQKLVNECNETRDALNAILSHLGMVYLPAATETNDLPARLVSLEPDKTVEKPKRKYTKKKKTVKYNKHKRKYIKSGKYAKDGAKSYR